LIGTAEIPLAGLALNQTFETNELPFRTVGFSHAFRREAGSRGAQSKGLYRLHQFSKVEMFIHCTHNQADNELQNMIDIQCDLLNQLGLHGRVLQMPTEELGASAHRKLDVEVWMPGRNEYGEVCSASDCTDYQSRRLNTQYIDRSEKSKKKQFVSTLNATAMAIPRVMLAILETHQVEDGTVKVPAPMIPFIGKDTIGVVEEQN
jgi:seryl-tRNA synthetase